MTKRITPFNDDDYEIVYVMSFRHFRTGQIIRSKDGKPFPLKIRKKKN
jgi:hypothetical protein